MIALGLHIPISLILVTTSIQKGHVFDNMILDIIILPTLFAATQLFKLMDKYRPETKQAKKERLRERAAARFVVRL